MPLTTAKLGSQGVRRLVQESDAYGADRTRAATAARTLRILQGNWDRDIDESIDRVFRQERTKVEVRKYKSKARNLARRAVNAGAVAYTQPPRRTLQGVGKGGNKALIDVLDEACIDTQAEQWERLAFGMGVVHVVPAVRKLDRWPTKRLVFDMILPHNAEAIFADDDPEHPAILVYGIEQGVERYCALDSERWAYYDEHFNEVRSVEHGLGRMPAVQFRVRTRPHGDYWDQATGDMLSRATIEVATINAHYRVVRKNSNSKLASFFSDMLDDGSEDTISTEQPIARAVEPGEASFQVHDYETLPDSFIKEMREIGEQVAESIGLPASRMDYQNEGAPYSPGEHAALAKLRTGSIKHLSRAERELVWTAVQMMHKFGHPLASKLNPEKVWKTYAADWGALTYVDDPLKMLQVSNELVKMAQSDPVTEYMKTHPNLTREEARAAVQMHIEERGMVTEFQAKHGIDNNPTAEPKDDRDSKSQQEGRVGGQASPPEPDGDAGESQE
tara:strand:- start:4271 stop:5779 length:1509 start_codon:yes stop_codon:yes gene_type:complete